MAKQETIESVLKYAVREDRKTGFMYDGACLVRVKFDSKTVPKETIEGLYEDDDPVLLPTGEEGVDAFADKVGGKSFTGVLHTATASRGYLLESDNKKKGKGKAPTFFTPFFDEHIAEVEILFEPTFFSVESLPDQIVFYAETISIGCQDISRKDAAKLHKAFGEWLNG